MLSSGKCDTYAPDHVHSALVVSHTAGLVDLAGEHIRDGVQDAEVMVEMQRARTLPPPACVDDMVSQVSTF